MKHLSVIIITRNEEEGIVSCINAAKEVADEIVVIDNESADRTAKNAKSAGAHVYTVRGLDFSYLRNFGKEKSQGEWLLYLDTDERISPPLAKEIHQTIKNSESGAGYRIVRKNHYFGTVWPKTEHIVRLIRKDALIGWQGVVHETAMVAGSIGQLQTPLLHFAHTDLTAMVKKTNEWSEIESQLQYKSNHPQMTWWRFFRVMLTAFWDSYIVDGGWRVGTVGLIESIYQSFSVFITYAKLWEKQSAARIRHESANPS